MRFILIFSIFLFGGLSLPIFAGDTQGLPTENAAKDSVNDSSKGNRQPEVVVPAQKPYKIRRSNFKTYHLKTKGVKIGTIDEDNKGKRYAISIGINNYNDSGINDLSKAKNDAKILGKILQTNGQFNPIYIMTDDIDPRKDKNRMYPTKSNIEQRLDSVLESIRPQDMLVFFFSGHGVSDYNENGYILPVDTNNSNIHATSIKVDDIVAKIKSKKIKKFILVLDACRDVAATTSKSVSNTSIKEKEFQEGEVAATFYSTKAGFFSYEDDESAYGVFTKYLVYGMEGKADVNNDNIVSFSELETFVVDGVKQWSEKKGKNQKPFTRIHDEKSGDLIITYSPNKTAQSIADKPLPKSLVGFDYASRSAAIPGWGQYYGDRKYKASAYLLITLGLAGNFAHQHTIFKRTQTEFNSIPLIPFTLNENALLLNFTNVSNGQKKLLNAENNMFNAGYALTAFWIFNIVDAFIFKSAIENPLKISYTPSFLNPSVPLVYGSSKLYCEIKIQWNIKF